MSSFEINVRLIESLTRKKKLIEVNKVKSYNNCVYKSLRESCCSIGDGFCIGGIISQLSYRVDKGNYVTRKDEKLFLFTYSARIRGYQDDFDYTIPCFDKLYSTDWIGSSRQFGPFGNAVERIKLEIYERRCNGHEGRLSKINVNESSHINANYPFLRGALFSIDPPSAYLSDVRLDFYDSPNGFQPSAASYVEAANDDEFTVLFTNHYENNNEFDWLPTNAISHPQNYYGSCVANFYFGVVNAPILNYTRWGQFPTILTAKIKT